MEPQQSVPGAAVGAVPGRLSPFVPWLPARLAVSLRAKGTPRPMVVFRLPRKAQVATRPAGDLIGGRRRIRDATKWTRYLRMRRMAAPAAAPRMRGPAP